MCIKNYSEVAYFFQGLPTSLCYTLSQIKHFCILVDKENVHLSFQIQNLRGRDQTRTFLFRIHASACKRQNESVTKMFWIRQESGKVSSSVNLVSENREHLKYFRKKKDKEDYLFQYVVSLLQVYILQSFVKGVQ